MKRFHALTKRLSLPILMAAALSGCTGDRYTEIIPAEEKDMYLLVELKVPGVSAPASRSLSLDAEGHINRLDVLAFNVDGTTETFAYHEEGEKQSNGTYQVRVQKSDPATQQFRFVFLANLEDTEVTNAVNHPTNGFSSSTTKANALAAIIFKELGAWSTTTPRYLPMWGESEATTIHSGSQTINAVQMLRAVARIDIETDDLIKNKFVIKEAYLYNYSTRGLAAPLAASYTPGSPNTETTPDAYITALSLPTDADGRGTVAYRQGEDNTNNRLKWETTAEKFERDIYVLEAPKTTAFGSITATALVIGGCYGGILNTTDKVTYYRIDLKSETSGYLDILRNYCYKLKVMSVTKEGRESPDEAFDAPIDIETEIIAWINGNSEEIICF